MHTRITEIVQTVSHVLHAVKPLVFEVLMFTWAMVEIGKFALAVVFGHGGE